VSDPEGFLTRWSRLKREADDAAPEAEPRGENEQTAEPERDSDGPPQAKPPDLPAVDLSALPSLESITATTDIRAFLVPGVPVELTRAALRRAWLADPAIRDFVGLAENAWDFNAPATVPGFGSTVPADIARRLVARVLGEETPTALPPSVDRAETVKKPDVGVSEEANAQHGTEEEGTVPEQGSPSAAADRDVDIAMHKDQASPDSPIARGRPHGGALPR
jgi:hypothetical protein